MLTPPCHLPGTDLLTCLEAAERNILPPRGFGDTAATQKGQTLPPGVDVEVLASRGADPSQVLGARADEGLMRIQPPSSI